MFCVIAGGEVESSIIVGIWSDAMSLGPSVMWYAICSSAVFPKTRSGLPEVQYCVRRMYESLAPYSEVHVLG